MQPKRPSNVRPKHCRMDWLVGGVSLVAKMYRVTDMQEVIDGIAIALK